MQALVIVGAAYAGIAAAAAARQRGYDGRIHLLSEEADPPYQRTFLSKSFLKEAEDPDDLPLRGEKFYSDLAIDLVLGERVTALSLADRAVRLASGGKIRAGAIVLATGAAERPLAFDKDLYEPVRTLAQARRLKRRLGEAQDVIVVGGGLIGLEVAAAARRAGKAVTVVEAGTRLLGRIASPEMAERILALHRANGVDILFDRPVDLRGDGRRRSLVLASGRVLHADVVAAGVGSAPNTALAQQAGLVVSDGVVTDAFGRSSVPEVFAAGDCARPFNSWIGDWSRTESVQSATDQGRAVGATVAGDTAATSGAPRFASTQFDLALQVVGVPGLGARTRVVDGGDRYSEIYERDGRVVGVASLGDPWLHNRARKALQTDPMTVKADDLLV